MAFVFWRDKSTRNVPPTFYPASQRLWSHTFFSGPHGDVLCFSFKCQHRPNHSYVLHLFTMSCPSAIFWRIWAIIIYAVNSMFRRQSSPHVSQEGLKRFLPSLTNLDATTTIIGIVVSLWVITSLFHSAPYVVFRYASQIWSLCTLHASATSCMATHKSRCISNECFAAVTYATPLSPSMTRGIPSEFKNNKSPKTLPSQILCASF